MKGVNSDLQVAERKLQNLSLEKLKQQRRLNLRFQLPKPDGRSHLVVHTTEPGYSSTSSGFVIAAHPGDSQDNCQQPELQGDADSHLEEAHKSFSDDLDTLPGSSLFTRTGQGYLSTGRDAPLHVKLQTARRASQLAPEPALSLLRRLRQTTAQLAYHQANLTKPVSLGQNHLPRDKPWLPGNGGVTNSKHRQARSADLSLPARPSARLFSKEASEKEVRLLINLQQRLRLRLAFAVMRQAAAAANLRSRMMLLIRRSETEKLVIKAVEKWHVFSVPNEEQLVAAFQFRKILTKKQGVSVIQSWRDIAEYYRCRGTLLAQAALSRRRLLLTACMAHWKAFMHLQHTIRLQFILAERWYTTWTLRKAITVWLDSTRRTSKRNIAFSRVTPGEDSSLAVALDRALSARTSSPNIKESMTQTRSALRPLALLAAEHVSQIPFVCVDLRWSGSQAWQEHQSEGSCMAVMGLIQWAPQPLLALESGGPLPESTSLDVYNPAAYSSPVKQTARRADASVQQCNVEAAAVEQELVWVQGAKQAVEAHLQEQLKEREVLQVRLRSMQDVVNDAAKQAEQAVHALEEAVEYKEQATAALASAHQAYQELQTEYTAAKELHDQCQQRRQQAAAVAADAQSALDEAVADQASCSTSAAAWAVKVETAAKVLARASPALQPAATVKLKEAQQRLQGERTAAAALKDSQLDMERRCELMQEELRQVEAAEQQAHQTASELALRLQQLSQYVQCKTATKEAAQEAIDMGEECVAAAQAQHADQERAYLSVQSQHDAVAQQVLRAQREASILAERAAELRSVHCRLVECVMDNSRWKHGVVVNDPWRGTDQSVRQRQLTLTDDEASGMPEPSHQTPAPAPAPSVATSEIQPKEPDADLSLDLPIIRQEGADSPKPESSGPLPGEHFESDSPQPLSPRNLRFDVHSAAELYWRRKTLLKVLRHFEKEFKSSRVMEAQADENMARLRVPPAFAVWRQATADTNQLVADAYDAGRRKAVFMSWLKYSRSQSVLHEKEAVMRARIEGRLLASCFHAIHAVTLQELWFDGIHKAIVTIRLRGMFAAWRLRARTNVDLNERKDKFIAAREAKTLASTWQYWLAHHRATTLLRRVFGAAVERWSARVGANAHTANFALLQGTLRAWQLVVLKQQEETRQEILGNAADAWRERRVAVKALSALRGAAAERRELVTLLPLRQALFVAWRSTAMQSEQHTASVVARQHHRAQIGRKVVQSWRQTAEVTNERLACFWLSWQVAAPLRKSLLIWQAVAKWQRRRRELTEQRENQEQLPEVGQKVQPRSVGPVVSNFRVAKLDQKSPEKGKCRPTAGAVPVSNAAAPPPLQRVNVPTPTSSSGSLSEQAAAWKSAADGWRQQHAFYTRVTS